MNINTMDCIMNNTFKKNKTKELNEKVDNLCKFTQEVWSSEEQMHIW